MTVPYLFISYSHSPEDQKAVNEFKERLESAGIEYFLDEKSIAYGEDIPRAVRLALEKATHVVAFLSPGSEESQWVFFEIGIAYSNDKTIVLRLLHSGMKIPSFLSNAKYMNCVQDETVFVEQIKPRQPIDEEEFPDELETYIANNVTFDGYDFERRKSWGPEFYCLHKEPDGEDTLHIFWNSKKKRLRKNTLAYGAIRWWGIEKLTRAEKKIVCEVLNLPLSLAG